MLPDSTQEITLGDGGVASAYVVLPLGTFLKEVDRLREAVKAHDKKRLDENKSPNIALDEVIYAFGHADLLARFAVNDLRSMLRFSYPEDSDAHVLNFILSVPCHVHGNIADPSKSMRFTMHLRVRRAIYTEDEPVASELGIVGYLCKRLKAADCAATVHVALGWADLIIDGVFDPGKMKKFAKFLAEVHEGSIVGSADERHAVFQRTMTILGLPWPKKIRDLHVPALIDATPAVFVRSEPGYLNDAIKRFGTKNTDIRLIDGKSDFVAIVKQPVDAFLRNNLGLSSSIGDESGTKALHRIQKLETHLVFSQPEEESERARTRHTTVGKTSAPMPLRCPCRRLKLPGKYVSPKLPESLKQSIDNLLLLSHSTLDDQMSCCDVIQAIQSARIALRRLSENIDMLHLTREARDAVVDATDENTNPSGHREAREACKLIQDEIEAKVHQLEVWHLLAERVLRQRTVATFDALLLQSDRSIVYRGSVQKFLFLADALMNDFLGRICKWPGLTPRFSAIGDSVPHILSVQGMGLVRIPPRHVFTLPFVVPDLWHEVAVYWFYKHARIEVFQRRGQLLSDGELGELGDLYGDLVVMRHGFGDWSRFAFSLTRAWLDSYDRQTLSPSVYRDNYDTLLNRLAFAQIVGDGTPGEIDAFASGNRKDDAVMFIKRLHAASLEFFPDLPRDLSKTRTYEIYRNLIDKLSRYAKPLLHVFDQITVAPKKKTVAARERKPYATKLERSTGSLLRFKPEDDMNLLMGELYWQFQLDRMARASKLTRGKKIDRPFQRMACTVRSAIIEYQHRQAKM